MGPRANLDECGKCRPYRDSFPGPASQQHVAVLAHTPFYYLGFVLFLNISISLRKVKHSIGKCLLTTIQDTHKLKLANKTFEFVADFRCLVTTLLNQNGVEK